MPKQATPVQLQEEERAALLRVAKRRKSGQQLVVRAKIVLEASSKLGEIRTTFEVKLTKSARRVEIDHLEPEKWLQRQIVARRFCKFGMSA